MNAYEMIERYVHEVGRHLPRKNREDIQMELHSLLQDTLEEPTAGSDMEPSTKMVAEYLREFGRPEEIAARYHPEQGLIGAKLFPTYRVVLTIALAIVAGVHLLGLLFLLMQNETADLGEALLNMLFNFGNVALVNIGLITLIFAGLERLDAKELGLTSKPAPDWDPYQLPPVKDPDRIDRFEIIAGIVFAALFIIAFNFFFEWIGFIDLTGEDRGVIPILALDFRQHIPWLTAAFALDALLKVVVLAQGRWNRTTRWLQVGAETFGIYVLYRILVSETIAIAPFFTIVAKGVIILIMVIAALEMLGLLYRLLFGRPFSPKNIFKSRMA